jgi:UDP-GlcNAc:undecaprenyl-phosphate/decaprenyl-phosphate GlcNAc-1-phosphate transferase
MTPTWARCLIVFAATLALIFLLSRLARLVGLVDYPGRRKRHRGDVPLIGGPAIFLGASLGAWLLPLDLRPYTALFASLGVLLIAGLLDDLRDLTPWQKLAAQLIAATLMVSWGKVVVTNLGDLTGFGELTLLRWGLPFTFVALIGLINAINMADGADGLAAGLATIALTFLAMSAFIADRVVPAHLLLIVIIAVLAFLALNMRSPWLPRARIFLGDSGSMMLGLLLTWFSVEVVRGNRGLAPIAAVWFLAMPLLDMGVVILRRIGKGQSPFRAGRDHFHHVLIATGLPPGTAVLLIHAIALALATAGFIAWRLGVSDSWMFYAFIALLAGSYVLSWRWRQVIRAVRRRARVKSVRAVSPR